MGADQPGNRERAMSPKGSAHRRRVSIATACLVWACAVGLTVRSAEAGPMQKLPPGCHVRWSANPIRPRPWGDPCLGELFPHGQSTHATLLQLDLRNSPAADYFRHSVTRAEYPQRASDLLRRAGFPDLQDTLWGGYEMVCHGVSQPLPFYLGPESFSNRGPTDDERPMK